MKRYLHTREGIFDYLPEKEIQKDATLRTRKFPQNGFVPGILEIPRSFRVRYSSILNEVLQSSG